MLSCRNFISEKRFSFNILWAAPCSRWIPCCFTIHTERVVCTDKVSGLAFTIVTTVAFVLQCLEIWLNCWHIFILRHLDWGVYWNLICKQWKFNFCYFSCFEATLQTFEELFYAFVCFERFLKYKVSFLEKPEHLG